MRDHVPVTVFQVKRPTVAPLLLCLPHLFMEPSQPLVLTVRQTLLVFSYLFLVNWSSHLITSSLETGDDQVAFRPAAPPTQKLAVQTAQQTASKQGDGIIDIKSLQA